MSLIPQKILSVVMAKSYFIQGTERNRTLEGRDKELHHRLGIKEGLFVIEFTCVYMVTTYASRSLMLFIPTWRETPHNPLSPVDATRRRCSQFSVVTTSSFSALTAVEPPLHVHFKCTVMLLVHILLSRELATLTTKKDKWITGRYD